MRTGLRLKSILISLLVVVSIFLLTACWGTNKPKQELKKDYALQNVDIAKQKQKEATYALKKAKRLAAALQAKIDESVSIEKAKYEAQSAQVTGQIAELESELKRWQAKEKAAEEDAATLKAMYPTEEEKDYYGSDEWKKAIDSGCDHPGGG